jgi:hypothetical protein
VVDASDRIRLGDCRDELHKLLLEEVRSRSRSRSRLTPLVFLDMDTMALLVFGFNEYG